jgi:hypothetical protein
MKTLGLTLILVLVGFVALAMVVTGFAATIAAPLRGLFSFLGLGLVMAMPGRKSGPWACLDSQETREERARNDSDLLRFEQESRTSVHNVALAGPHYIVTPWGSLAMDYIVEEHGHYVSCERGQLGPRNYLTFTDAEVFSIQRRDTGYYEITLQVVDDGREPADSHYYPRG